MEWINNNTAKNPHFLRVRNVASTRNVIYLILKDIYICTGRHKIQKLFERAHFPDIL